MEALNQSESWNVDLTCSASSFCSLKEVCLKHFQTITANKEASPTPLISCCYDEFVIFFLKVGNEEKKKNPKHLQKWIQVSLTLTLTSYNCDVSPHQTLWSVDPRIKLLCWSPALTPARLHFGLGLSFNHDVTPLFSLLIIKYNRL